ncbi:hypothetical protein FOZ62_019573 [Perkinsus olseni]|uniref:Uncharacterized protein n=1 Tax=Perkinsus olseni TaxID=32597 RepID=A0A7J6R7X9_PEROL|nr:hypothetical protein FOZ62_019573 [Perkinsus olseni]
MMMAIGEEEEKEDDNKGGKGTRDREGMFILWWLEVNDGNEFNVKSKGRIAVKLDIIPTNNYIEGSMHDDDEDEEEGEAWFTAICNIPPTTMMMTSSSRDDECEPDDDDDTSLNGPVIILDLPQCSKIMHIQCVMDRHADAWFKALTKLLSDNGSGHYLKEEEDNPNQTTTSSSPHADTTSDADTGEILTEESYEVVDESNDDDDDDSEDYTISNTNIECTMMSNTTNGGDDDEDESSDDDDGTSSEGEEGHYDDDDDDDDDDSLSIQTEISLLKSIVMQRDDIIQNMQREGTRYPKEEEQGMYRDQVSMCITRRTEQSTTTPPTR